MISYKKNGGLHFLRIGRLSINFSIKKANKKSTKVLTPFHKQIALEQANRESHASILDIWERVVSFVKLNKFVFG